MKAKTPDALPWNARRFSSSRPNASRTSYEVDRDRILHSATFRELQYKTQVQSLLGHRQSWQFRTRLNHVIEVAQIARAIAERVGGDGALAEAVALAHDLGHPPFGHAGERALAKAVRDHGQDGWNANVHSLAVVDEFELAFASFRGLDLTWATREGIARHSTPFDEPVSFGEFTSTPNGGLECQVVDVSDVLAYLSHDLDDALAGNYLSLDDLAGLPVLDAIVAEASNSWESGQHAWPEQERPVLVRRRVVARLLGSLIEAISRETRALLESEALTPSAVRQSGERVVAPRDEHEALVRELLDRLTSHYYRSPQVAEADVAAADLVSELMAALITSPELIPERFRSGDQVTDAAVYLASLNDFAAVDLAASLGASVN